VVQHDKGDVRVSLVSRLAVATALAALVSCGPNAPSTPESAATVDVTEWMVPYPDSRPRDPFYQDAHHVWFVGQRDGYLAYLDPETGDFVRYDLPEGAGPHDVIVDDDGIVWFAENVLGWIGRLAPDGTMTQVAMPDPAATDPHTLIDDGKGHIWFTVQGANFVGRLTKATRTVDLMTVPSPGARPYGITLDAEGRPWIALFGTNKLATVDPENLAITEIELPRTGARPRRIAATPDGRLWYGDYEGGFLGRYDPLTKSFKEWPVPGGKDAKPYGLAADAKGRLWFVETGLTPNRLVGFDPKTDSFFSITPIESGGGAVRHIMYHAPSNTLWFGTDTNTIARAILP
jgi:virginiamycin B lyase